MTKKEITIQLDSGLETRPVALLVQVASQYDSDIYIESDNRNINAKSIMGMMALGLVPGEKSLTRVCIPCQRKVSFCAFIS